MEFVTSLDSMDVVMKQCGLEVPCLNDFFGGGYTREVTTTRTIVEIVQDYVIFVDGKTFLKNSVDPSSIKNLFDE
jgi:hypothetical protein